MMLACLDTPSDGEALLGGNAAGGKPRDDFLDITTSCSHGFDDCCLSSDSIGNALHINSLCVSGTNINGADARDLTTSARPATTAFHQSIISSSFQAHACCTSSASDLASRASAASSSDVLLSAMRRSFRRSFIHKSLRGELSLDDQSYSFVKEPRQADLMTSQPTQPPMQQAAKFSRSLSYPRQSPGSSHPTAHHKTLVTEDFINAIRAHQARSNSGACLLPSALLDARSSSTAASSTAAPLSRLASASSAGHPPLLEIKRPPFHVSPQGPELHQHPTNLSLSSDIGLDAGEVLAAAAQPVLEESNAIAASPHLPHAMSRAHWSVDDYDVLKLVHQGYASNVYQATCKLTNQMVAFKVYAVDELEDLARVQLSREINIHPRCQHENIVQLHVAFVEHLAGLPLDPRPSPLRAIVLVVDWCGGGNLAQLVHKQRGSLSEAKAVNLVLLPLLTSLQYLHSQGIVHRDIKPANLIFDDDLVLKVVDFGLALDLREERANTRTGTLEYMAPEVLMCPTKRSPGEYKLERGARHYATGADAWAVGTLLYELLVGAPPFRSDSPTDTMRNIMAGRLWVPTHLSSAARDLIALCLQADPLERPTVGELLEHPLVAEMRSQASFKSAARHSNSFVEFLQRLCPADEEPDLGLGRAASAPGAAQR